MLALTELMNQAIDRESPAEWKMIEAYRERP